MASIVLTFIGDDRPGLVDALSTIITEHGGNWEESRMAQLAGKFAGVLLVKIADEKADSLSKALNALETQGLLHIMAERSSSEVAPPSRELHLELVGQDHPGIVHDISHALASRKISIEELNSATESASMGGGDLFRAEMRLRVPDEVNSDELRDLLESLADELMVDISLDS